MAVVTELFRSEDNGTLSFGDYTLAQKAKKGDIQFEGDIYKIKTFKTMTKLDKNGQLIFESVPGSAVHNFVIFAASVVMSLPSGWGSVLPVSSGILLQKRKLQKRKKEGRSL